MRMWAIHPNLMCREHLLGEHLEMHMFVGSIRKGISIKGYIDKGLIDPSKIEERHNQLAKEMLFRGYLHDSPIVVSDLLLISNSIDKLSSLKELKSRCSNCFKKI